MRLHAQGRYGLIMEVSIGIFCGFWGACLFFETLWGCFGCCCGTRKDIRVLHPKVGDRILDVDGLGRWWFREPGFGIDVPDFKEVGGDP